MLFRFSVPLIVALSAAGTQAQFSGPQSCAANPECAHLADNCCPTNQAGIFLDCCENKLAACDANSGCAGLNGECCPTADGTFLYCCFEDIDGGYKYDATYWAHARGTDIANFYASTGTMKVLGAYTHVSSREYTRNPELVYDIVYLKGDVPDAGAYITGEKKIDLNLISTTAPPCTQIILQFEHIDFGGETSSNKQGNTVFQSYPKNRHR